MNIDIGKSLFKRWFSAKDDVYILRVGQVFSQWCIDEHGLDGLGQ